MLEIDWQWWLTKLTDPQAYVRQVSAFLNIRFLIFYVSVAVAIQLLFLFSFLRRRRREAEGHAWSGLVSRDRMSMGIKRAIRYLAPPEVISRKSFVVDVQFWLLACLGITSLIAKALAFIFLLDQVPVVFSYLGLENNSAVKVIRSSVSELDETGRLLVVFLVAFVSYDLASYWAHRLVHTKFLWEFHKVHHYPGQINVLAGHRFHPIDSLVQYAVTGVCTATAVTIVAPLDSSNFYSSYSPYLDQRAWWYASFVFYGAYFGRLVHSHFPIYFGKFFGKLLVSPAFHMIHHSKIIANHNFGGMFAIWDYLFGTHHDVSSLKDYDYHVEHLGVPDMPDEAYTNVIQAMYRPFVDAWRVLMQFLRRSVHREPPKAKTEAADQAT